MGASKLIIVESPAKAATIEGYLGPDYHVTASIGHIRDLPQPKDLPTDMKKGPYGRFSVDVDHGFTPYYAVNPDKKKKVSELKKALKEADELYLATDEDREGEAIAWHLLEVLKPKVPVKRMVFHEITKEAISRALDNTRELDTSLVDAQETRRILDRLYGYEVSPLLWRKIRPSLSAGRVQSVATRLVVDRERDRMAHISAEYWSIQTRVEAGAEAFEAKVTHIDGRALATGADFSEKGVLGAKATAAGVVHLDEARARAFAQALEASSSSVIEGVTQKPYRRRPAAPFTTSTLQQEASRKLHWNAASTMRTAQSLYESGYITYMRTDSTALSSQAIAAARAQARELYGSSSIPDAPRVYGKVAKGAQEAHEAIRPAGDHFRTPAQVSGELNRQELALYDLIWKRTVASQMVDAVGFTASIRVLTGVVTDDGCHDLVSTASGTVITDPGFRRAYEEGRDRGRYDSEKDSDTEKVLPNVAEGDAADIVGATPDGHETQPPGRYTEATLVKTLEERGIGRPSTYAATIQTIGDRGYITHRGQNLVPTWLAFSVTRLLEENLGNLVDYDFTASMEDDLDKIAAGEESGVDFLSLFYLGADGTGEADGLKFQVASLGDDIDARAVNSQEVAEGVVVRVGRYGPYLEKEDGSRANLPDGIAPDEIDDAKIAELFALAAADGRELGVDPATNHVIVAKSGRFGPYVTEILPETQDEGDAEHTEKTKRKSAAPKPRTASLFASMDLATVDLDQALRLLALPREVGIDPSTGEVITAQNGRYGPYLKKGTDSRTLSSEELIFTISLDEALEIYSQPKTRGRGSAKPPLREFGEDPVSGKKVTVKDGRFGPYITDGETNVTIPRAETVEDLTQERAFELLADKRAKGPAPKKTRSATKRTATKKTSTRSTAKKPASKKSASKK